jgi:hypothetical protein
MKSIKPSRTFIILTTTATAGKKSKNGTKQAFAGISFFVDKYNATIDYRAFRISQN